jgi:hypothetical protein
MHTLLDEGNPYPIRQPVAQVLALKKYPKLQALHWFVLGPVHAVHAELHRYAKIKTSPIPHFAVPKVICVMALNIKLVKVLV